MVKIVWEIWPLKELKQILHINKLEDFVNLFYELESEEKILAKEWEEECEKEINDMKKTLEEKNKILKSELELYIKENKSIINKILSFFSDYNHKRKIWIIKKEIQNIETKIKDIENDFKNCSIKKVKIKLNEIEYKYLQLKSLKPIYWWALWEKKVINKFEQIKSSGILINDFNKHFDRPIFKKWSKDPIMSIQIDHIFISERGIFLIETKNWKEKPEWAFSPIKQAERHNTAFYRVIERVYKNDRKLNNKKIPKIYNIVLFTWEYTEKSNNYFIYSLKLNQIKDFVESKKPIITIEEYRYLSEQLIITNEN